MMIHFIRPNCLYLLIPALLYLIWIAYSYRQHNPWKNICDPHLLPALLQPAPSSSRRFINLALFLFFSICIFALAGPSWKKTALPVYRDLSSLMLVLDLSPNMNIPDLKPNRLTRAKFTVRDLINLGQNVQMGLVVFTDEAYTASPLSQDANTLNALIDELTPQMMPTIGSDSGQGLKEAYKLLEQASANQGNILLITASEPTANSWTEAKMIAEHGGHVNVLAMLENTANNQSLIADLQQLARIGNGSFHQFTATADAADNLNLLAASNNNQSIKNTNTETINLWSDAGPWFCLLLLPIALCVLRETMRHEKN